MSERDSGYELIAKQLLDTADVLKDLLNRAGAIYEVDPMPYAQSIREIWKSNDR